MDDKPEPEHGSASASAAGEPETDVGCSGAATAPHTDELDHKTAESIPMDSSDAPVKDNNNTEELGECTTTATATETDSSSVTSATVCVETGESSCQEDDSAAVTEITDSSETETTVPKELIEFKVIYSKNKYDIEFPLESSVLDLKRHLEGVTGVPPGMQKLMYKGLARDDYTLRQLKITRGAKVMLVGSTLNDVMSVAPPSKADVRKADEAEKKKVVKLCEKEMHKKILAKYPRPADALPAYRVQQPLPSTPLTGMYNKYGLKVRLNFKLETDELIISTKERTNKVPMNSITNVTSGEIDSADGATDYHIVGFQMGPTEQSIYWVYWVPGQYVEAIKDTVLGHWGA